MASHVQTWLAFFDWTRLATARVHFVSPNDNPALIQLIDQSEFNDVQNPEFFDNIDEMEYQHGVYFTSVYFYGGGGDDELRFADEMHGGEAGNDVISNCKYSHGGADNDVIYTWGAAACR